MARKKADTATKTYMSPSLTKELTKAIKAVAKQSPTAANNLCVMQYKGQLYFSNSHVVVAIPDKEWVISYLRGTWKLPIDADWWNRVTENETRPIYGRWNLKTEFSGDKAIYKNSWEWLEMKSTHVFDTLRSPTDKRFTVGALNLAYTSKTEKGTVEVQDLFSLYVNKGNPEKTQEEKGLMYIQQPYANFLQAFHAEHPKLMLHASNPKACACFYTMDNDMTFIAGIMPLAMTDSIKKPLLESLIQATTDI